MRKIHGDQVVHCYNSWVELIINKEDGYVNATQLTDQISMWLFQELKQEDMKELAGHIKNLTGRKGLYKAESPWDNLKGWYIHPMIALELVAIKKYKDPDYAEYYEFVKKAIFGFLDDNPVLKEQYFFMEEFHG